MKIYKTTAILLIALFSLSSCLDEWLEVESNDQILEQDLFGNSEGYRTALNGIYTLLGDINLYGKELTYGMVSVLAKTYDEKFLWDNSYTPVAEYDYENKYFQDRSNDLWSSAFRVIANCNLLIQNVEKRDTSFFIKGRKERDFLLGEAVGIRGLMHFEMLRLYAPAPVVNDGGRYVPYVNYYPTPIPERLSVDSVLAHSIRDFELAAKILCPYDTINANGNRPITPGTRFNISSEGTLGDVFFDSRGTRMNYFAATALIARAYLWKGDKTNALRYCEELFRWSGNSGREKGKQFYKFTTAANMTASAAYPDNIYRKLFDDLYFAPWNGRLLEILKERNDERFYLQNTDELFKDTPTDRRGTNYIVSSGESKKSAKWEIPTTTIGSIYPLAQCQLYICPVIRQSEIFYMMSECLAETNLSRAIEIMNYVRVARGANRVNPGSASELLKILRLEYTKEFLAEGQTFFVYKRLNMPLYYGTGQLDLEGKWVLPLPKNENVY